MTTRDDEPKRLQQALETLEATVTPLGRVLAVVLVVAIVAGAAFGLVEAWVVAAIALVLLLLAIPFLLGGARYAIEFGLDTDRVVAGSELGAELVVTNVSRRAALPAVLDVPVGPGLLEAAIPALRRGATHREAIRIDAPRRGIIQIGPMTLTRGDPIGVLRRETSWPQVETVHVHPVTTRLPATTAGFLRDVEGQPTRTIVDSDLAFHAIREYRPGDASRHVHWKSTAKTGTLMVRQFEESRRSRIAVLLDTRTDSCTDEDEFELAVSAATSLALQAVRERREVHLVTAGSSELARGVVVPIDVLPSRSPKALLDATCAIELDDSASGLDELARRSARHLDELSIAFLVTGARLPAATLRRAAHEFGASVVTVVVRVEPGAEPSVRTAGDLTILTIGLLEDLGHLIARGAVE